MTKRGEKFASARADWTKKSNISQMYDVIYGIMVEARIASERPKPVFVDRGGNKVETSERFGLKQDIEIKHPDYMIFGDESGCQTNQKNDKSVGNTAHVVEHGTVPWTMCSINNHRLKSFRSPPHLVT